MAPTVLEQDFHGRIIKQRISPGFRVTENVYTRHSWTPKHYHTNGMLGWVLDGSYTNAYSHATLDVRNSVFMFCPAGEVHTTSSEAGAHCFTVEVETLWLKRLEEASLPNVPTTFEKGSVDMLARRLYNEFNQVDRASSVAVEGLILEVIALAMRLKLASRTKPPRWLTQATEILHETYRDPITIAEIAEQVLVHPVYLASTFRSNYGCSIGDYVRQLRASYAARRLSDSEEPIAAIAQNSGFSDQSHFSRTFKQLTGMTPAMFRSVSRRA